jgi:hypothetical protein
MFWGYRNPIPLHDPRDNSQRTDALKMNRCVRLSLLTSILLCGCSNPAPNAKKSPSEQNIPITFGGFIQGGNEKETVDGICRPDIGRSILTCDIHNGLPGWTLTQLDIRITTSPYSDSDVKDYRQRVLIPSLNTGSFTFHLGATLPNDTSLAGKPLTHWGWLIAGAWGTREIPDGY